MGSMKNFNTHNLAEQPLSKPDSFLVEKNLGSLLNTSSTSLQHSSSDLVIRDCNSEQSKMSSSSVTNESANISSQLVSLKAEPYVMNGSRGYCYACNLELTSLQHCNQHISGSKHIKKLKETTNTSFYNTDKNSVSGQGISHKTEIFAPPSNTPQFLTNGFQQSSVLANTEHNKLLDSSVKDNSENILSQLGSPKTEHYVMNGSRGFCHVCNLELTSLQHCNQHISGSKHIKKVKETTNTSLYNVYNTNTNLTSGQSLLTPANSHQFLPDHSQQAVPYQSPFLAKQSPFSANFQPQPMTKAVNPSPSYSPLKGPNGEAYIMNGTRGYCYVCSVELTSQEHAQSHLGGTKHKKKSGADTVSSMDTSLSNGKVLMCSLCKVPFSCIKNAEEHFRSDKHKKKAASVPKDYSNDPEQTQVMKPYPSYGPKLSDSGDLKNYSHFMSGPPKQEIFSKASSTDPDINVTQISRVSQPLNSYSHVNLNSSGFISPVVYTEILDLAKGNEKRNAAPVEVVADGKSKLSSAYSEASFLVSDQQCNTASLNYHKDESLNEGVSRPEQPKFGSLRNTEMAEVRLTHTTESGVPPFLNPVNKDSKDTSYSSDFHSPKNYSDDNLNASLCEVDKLKNKFVPTDERQACSELNLLNKDGQSLHSSIIDNTKQMCYSGSISQNKPALTQQFSEPFVSRQIKHPVATCQDSHLASASMGDLQHSQGFSLDLCPINPSLPEKNAIDPEVTLQLSVPFNSTQIEQQQATSRSSMPASMDYLQHSEGFSLDSQVLNPSLIEHNSTDPDMKGTAHPGLTINKMENLQQNAFPEPKNVHSNLSTLQSAVPHEQIRQLQTDSRTRVNENLSHFSNPAVNSSLQENQHNAFRKQPIMAGKQGLSPRVLYFTPFLKEENMNKPQHVDQQETLVCQSSNLNKIYDKEKKESNLENLEVHSKNVDIIVKTEAFPTTLNSDETSAGETRHSAPRNEEQGPPIKTEAVSNTGFEENCNQFSQQLPEAVANMQVNGIISQKDHSQPESSQQIKETVPSNQVGFLDQQRQPFDCIQSLQKSMSSLQINTLSPELPSDSGSEKEQYYYFNGSKGFCHACSIELTSFQHTNQHINGQKHQKKVQQMHFTKFVQKESKLPLAVSSDHFASPPYPQENGFIFDGNRGMCHVCQIELTSLQHATQHLNGKIHKRNKERRNLQNKGIIYPLNCEVCNKSFTGTESAVQHFTSSKHKNKAQLLEKINPSWNLQGDRVMVKDGLTWFICDVCQCGVNTREQLVKHKETLKHKELAETLSRREATQTPVSPRTVTGASGEQNDRPVKVDDTRQEHILADNQQHLTYGETPKIVMADEVRQKLILADNQQHLTYGETPKICLDRSSPQGVKYTSPLQSQEEMCLDKNQSIFRAQPIGRPILGAAANVSLKPENLQSLVLTQVTLETQVVNKESDNSSFGCTLNFANSRGSGAHSSQNDIGNTLGGTGIIEKRSGNTLGGTGIIEKRSNSIVEQFENLNIGAVGGRPSGMYSSNGSVAEDSDNDESVAQHGLDLGSSEYIKKPGKPRHTNSRGGEKGKISIDRQENELETDEDDLMEENEDLNIPVHAEIIKIDTSLTVVEKPERSTKHGFKYYCRTCDKHMNTIANYDAHIAGASHLYISSLQKSPPRQLDPIRKNHFFQYSDILQYACKLTTEVPRLYQTELLHKTMMGDYIVYLPTGTGKTLVAVMTMALMLYENPSRPVLFLVDKVLLVLQQAKYIKSQLHEKRIKRLNDNKEIVQQEVIIKAICGGITSKSGRPIWKYDIVVTTAAFCQNMLERGLIRWEDFSLVVLDEVHHCNKQHPYFKLLDKYHNILPFVSRPKILGLTASPAGKSSIQETYDMLQGLLKNLGGAKIAIVENEEEDLKSNHFTAEIHPVCVPLSSKERGFRKKLLEYIVLCYSKLARMSNLRTATFFPCSLLTDAVKYPADRQISIRIAESFLKDDGPLSDLIGLINSSCPQNEVDFQKFSLLKMHLIQVMLSLSEVGTGADFVSDLAEILSPENENVKVFSEFGLPCGEMHEIVLRFSSDGNKDLTMFSKLIETLQDKSFIDWRKQSSKALILVRERKLARQLTKKLRENPLIEENELKVQYLVGHGGGAQSHGMDVKKQKRVLDNQEKYNIFVATSIMEEGIDFQLLELVISMNPPTSLRALVQIRGRARKKSSHFVILCSSEEEVEKLNKLQIAEKNMQAAAKRCIEEDRLKCQSATHCA